ncbi:hypothetical protein EVJ58_g1217 [Rhodofomes roseus]|uniref:Acyl-CoA thioesterase FadM n=1 Tax=Rhodofomes roseus TaxID=34475 RepID=A0A4Y9Z2K7_9APHY|nr:hypothetical protein EVJ58_g1217 [Rhodofomes roseus]
MLSSRRSHPSARHITAMFWDGLFKDTVMDAVRSLARLPTFRVSVGSLSFSLLKYVAVLLFLVNARSWPLTWHFRVFRPVMSLRLRWYMLQLRLLLKPKQVKRREKAKWLQELCPVGQDPLEFVYTWKGWASPDDSDFNLHLSNSCYAKNLDCARLEAALKYFPTLCRAGGWIALGATHFNFLREIPILAPYEIRMRIAGWDSKWQEVQGRQGAPRGQALGVPRHDRQRAHGRAPYPVLHTPADPLDAESKSGVATPTHAEALARASMVHVEPDGATLNCVVVNALCFKTGRITIPPALVLAVEGFVAPPSAGADAEQFSLSNPPPFWGEVQKLIGEEPTDLRRLQKFYAGGWREVPEGERWWEKAVEGLEERRKAGMEVVGALRSGMEGVRSL